MSSPMLRHLLTAALAASPVAPGAALVSTAAAATTTTGGGTGGAPGATSDFALTYDVYAHGLRAMRMLAQIRMTPQGYSATLAYHTVGFASMINHSQVTSEAGGSFVDGRAVPQRFTSGGYSRGADRRTTLAYHDGQPTVTEQSPPEPTRDPVAAAAADGSMDTLSAIVTLLHEVADGHGCNLHLKVYDGLRLSTVTASDDGAAQVASSDRSPFDGPAHRCDFVANQIGGILHDGDEAASHRPMHGNALLAVPTGPQNPDGAVTVPVPIRAGFENPDLGYGDLYLVKAERLQ